MNLSVGAAATILACSVAVSQAMAERSGSAPRDEGARVERSAAETDSGAPRGKIIGWWDHLEDSDGRTLEDFSVFVSYRRAHAQVWSGEFTDGVQIGGYIRDRRRSTYSGLYRFRDGFDHVLQFDTEQVLGRGLVLATMLRAIKSIPDDAAGDEYQFQLGTGLDWYRGDYDFLSFRAVNDPREGGRWSFIASHRFHFGEPYYVQPGVIQRTDGSTSWFLRAKLKRLLFLIGDFNQFDYSAVDRRQYSIGFEIPY